MLLSWIEGDWASTIRELDTERKSTHNGFSKIYIFLLLIFIYRRLRRERLTEVPPPLLCMIDRRRKPDPCYYPCYSPCYPSCYSPCYPCGDCCYPCPERICWLFYYKIGKVKKKNYIETFDFLSGNSGFCSWDLYYEDFLAVLGDFCCRFNVVIKLTFG